MKIILGDNQFFGINHSDLKKGESVKTKFKDNDTIFKFINESLSLGMDGFMMNSNIMGYSLLNKYCFPSKKEIHYSIPYAHKYASIVNEDGMLSLFKYFLIHTSFLKILSCLPKYLITQNLKFLVPLATSLEIPKCLPKGSYIYLQNILTDLIIGIDRVDILEYFALEIRRKGYKLGIVTLNPLKLDAIISNSLILNDENLILCFNINHVGFNVFPSKSDVEKLIKKEKKYKVMGMSIFASGGSNINESINYIKNLKLDYIVFGSSNIKNISNNLYTLRENC